jgi:hypothetical protein
MGIIFLNFFSYPYEALITVISLKALLIIIYAYYRPYINIFLTLFKIAQETFFIAIAILL